MKGRISMFYGSIRPLNTHFSGHHSRIDSVRSLSIVSITTVAGLTPASGRVCPTHPLGCRWLRRLNAQRHHLPDGATVNRRPVLGGLHHEYQLDLAA